ncbi:accessory gene regulator protein B [Gottschalkia acidurici 9a]|uniref:Accessory gene regulator protein B n=1 Tax=Gottschalkia acidurici (strain ATCC 7906 / DSM 604 / BCRC 14475 / CIP 104303 / KCTC 5404 / NCIMB 10678 / 9a) TaxID=1128398 RepID=K0AXH5_GOTA9|nr:accessory gene regulator B family protein [Gottschalkia acidurici]AFS77146.1 accessory gene regulator protein B [Gottschalkia acidurici 9a]
MIKSCANKVTSFLVSNDAINDEEYEVYSYGFETLLAFIINISVILLLGLIVGKFVQTLLFLTCYCPIRQFTGGYHANSYRNCLLVFVFIFSINIITLDKLSYMNLNEVIICTTLISYIGICLLAPIEHRYNPLSTRQRKSYKKVAILLTSIVLIFVLLGIKYKPIYEYVLYSASVLVWIFIMLILAIIKKIRRE